MVFVAVPLNVVAVTTPLKIASPTTSNETLGFSLPIPRFDVDGLKVSPTSLTLRSATPLSPY